MTGPLSLALIAATLLSGSVALAQASSAATVLPPQLDAAPFGYTSLDEGGKAWSIRWGEPRKIVRFELEFDGLAPAADTLKVQYWHRHWDGKPDPAIDAGDAGWAPMDDWTNGKWKDAQVTITSGSVGPVFGSRESLTITFKQTDSTEFKDLKGPGVTYRKTLKLRLLGTATLPKVTAAHAFTPAATRPIRVHLSFGKPADPTTAIQPDDVIRLECFNGQATILGEPAAASAGSPPLAELPMSVEGRLSATVLMAADPVDPARYDRTVVTVRSKYRPFSFAPDELAAGQRILVDDLGVLVSRAEDEMPIDQYRVARRESPGKSVYHRVLDESEQTLARAWDDMPLKRQLYFVHGLPGCRNVMKHEIDGGVEVSNHGWFRVQPSPRDTERKAIDGGFLDIGFGLPDQQHRVGRELAEGWLPILTSRWLKDGVLYEQTAVLDALDGTLDSLPLDEPTMLLVTIRVLNTGTGPAEAALALSSTVQSGREPLAVEEDRLYAVKDGKRRLRLVVRGAGSGSLKLAGDRVDWTASLAPAEAQTLTFLVPSITIDKPDELAALAARDLAADTRRIAAFWRALDEPGCAITTPEPWINDFYKSHLRHLQVNCFKDLKAPRRYAHVGTFHYGAFTNESVMMVSDLDRRGYHAEAAECLQAWLDGQGTTGLPGNFKSNDGVFYGAFGHEHGGYNKHHGYALWGFAEHWRYTRDRKWMEASAPGIIKACEFIIRERQATMTANPDGSRPIEYGYLPAGGLEDVQDYWYWQATNACSAWGFDAAAEALADFGHPDAARIQKEAAAYHHDVVAALTESRVRSPVVKLRDGTYVPKFPSRLYERGRCMGWIRETLEGSLVLLLTGMVAPDTAEARWIMQDYEDNLYISETYGYDIANFERFWFSRGGISMQANLLDGPIPYIQRDQPEHFLRAYFNGLASAFYPEIRMCNEHSLPELGYPRGDHFKTSDEAQSTYWLRLMFIHEAGEDLYLGQAIPRDWMKPGHSASIERAATHFGPMSLKYAAAKDGKRITATLTPPTRNAPKRIFLRFRHPASEKIKSVTVNGQPCTTLDAAKDRVVLPGTLTGKQDVVAAY